MRSCVCHFFVVPLRRKGFRTAYCLTLKSVIMKKFFSFFAALMATTVMAFATEIAVPTTTLDLQDPTIVTTAGWYGEVAYSLDDDVLVVSGYESYKSVEKQTWITYATTGSNASTWDALAPFKGSEYYTTASYATLQAGRYTAYLVTGCDSVWLYGKNNSASKYLRMNIYDLTGSSATVVDDAATEATFPVSNTATTDPMVLKQALDAAKTYLIVTTGVGGSNSRVFEIAFFRHPGGGEPKTYWTVAGNSTAVFGSEWAPTDKANDMVKQEDGSYKWEKTGLQLAAGTIAFKVCKDHAWTEAYPASDYELAIPETAEYTITITFEPENENKVSAVATKTGEAEVDPTAAVRGGFNGWAGGDMELSGDKKSASLTVALEAQTYGFKMVINDAWQGNGATVTREANTVAGLNENTGDMNIKADVAGDYTFTWTFETKTLVVTFPKKVDPNQMYVWNGNGVTKAEEAIELGGAAEAVQADGTNIEVGVKQKGNWCLKANKGFNSGAYYLGIAMDNAVNAGDTVKIAYFRTTSKNTYVLGLDFSADKASAATTYQILTEGDPQVLESDGIPEDVNFIVPEGVENAKYLRIYRNSGGTGLWVSKVEVVKATGEPTPPADPTAAVIGSMTEWAMEIPFTLSEDKKKASLTINDIPAGDYEFKMVINGEWRSNGYTYHRDFPGAAGITGNEGANMIFKADIAGTYTFEWYFENDSLAFIFPAKPEPTDPTAAVIGSFNDWSEEIPFELSEDKKKATLFNDNIKEGTYYFKMIINGEWRSNGYEFHRDFPGAAGISGNSEENMSVYIDVEGAYTFEWYFENDSLAIIFPAKPESGYYLMGSFNDWAVDAANLFQSNLEAEGEEYVLGINLTAGDAIKVAYVMAGHTMEWFPKEDNYTVDANHAGPTTMYFRPVYNEEWAAFGGYFYIVPTSTEGIEETLAEGKAVKVVRDGQVLILKADSTFNVMGQRVK